MGAPPPPPGLAAPAPAPRRPLVVRALGTAVRVAMVLGILGAGYTLLDLYRNLFTDPAEVPPPASSTTPPAEEPPADFGGLLLDDGEWTVGGVGWAVRVKAADAGDAARAAGDPVPPGRGVSDVERDLLRWAKGGNARTAVAGHPGCSAYESAVGGARVRVVTELAGGAERVRLGQVVCGGGTLLEFTPTAAADGVAEPLLPVPAGVQVQARRWSSGRVTAELIAPWDAGQAFPAEWAAAGWVGRPAGEGADAGWEFRRGAAVVWAWRFGLPGGSGSLLLARPRGR